MKKFFLIACSCILLTSCERLNNVWHSRTIVDLPAGKKLVSISWRNGDPYYLLRDARPGETPERYTLSEQDNLVSLDDSYIIVEH